MTRPARPALLLATALVAVAVAAPAAAEDLSGQIVVVESEGRVRINLTSAHLQGGEEAQVVRITIDGAWIRAATGKIVQVSPTEAVMDITAYDPNMRAAVVGDYVVVTKRDAAAYPAQAQPSPGVPLLPPTDPDAIMGSARGRLDQGEPAGPEGPPVWHQFSATLGVKGFVGFAGKDVPAGADAAQKAALATEDGRAGLGWMVGPTLELRGFRFLAFETGYLHSSSTLKKDTFFTGGNVKQEVTSSGGRVPLLLKLVLPSDSVHAWLGGGIDFWFGKDSELKLKGGTLVEPSTDPPVPVAIGSVEPADQTFWILDLGFAYVVESIVLSIEVRAYYNPDIDANWKDYFKNQVEAGEHTIDAGLMLGLGYELDVLELLEQP